jgi:N-methylhydantoinase A
VTASGVLDVANSSMERALRVVSVERGFDARDFTLVAFGGAGPLHACDLAAALSIRRVLVPRYPGILSAMGMALADSTRDVSSPLMAPVPSGDCSVLERKVRSTVTQLSQSLRRDLGSAATMEAAVDMRYTGQGFELTVPWHGSIEGAASSFHDAHALRYGHADPARAIELTVARVRGRVRRAAPALPRPPEGRGDATAAAAGQRQVTFERALSTTVYDRDKLLAGNRISGPALVTQMDSTTLIPPGWQAIVDPQGNLVLESR